MDMRVIISQMAVLFILIAAGYICGKIRMLTAEGVRVLSKVVINISTPSTILNSVLSDTGNITGGKTAYFVLLVLLAYALFFLIALPASRVLAASERLDMECGVLNSGSGNKNGGLYASMIVFGNVGFMGFPIALAIFGAQSAFYVALVNVIFNILSFSAGIVLISGKGGKINLRVLLNATLVASCISFIIVFTDFRAPSIITDTVRLAGGINTPCAMLVIGATLSQVPVKDVFTKWRLYPVALLKVIVAPVLTWIIFRQFVTDGMLLGVLTVLSGMPIAAAVAMISIEYGGDERIASSGVFLTTLLSGVTIPLIVYVLLL